MKNKHIQNLIEETLAIEAEAAKTAGTLGYMARTLIQATMPHSNPGNVEAWGRENGVFSLVMQPGVVKKNGELIRIGLPYGSVPRLLLAWITTEAVRTKNPNLILGPTLSGFMGQLGLIPAGGRWGTIIRLREQMKRLFSAFISCYYNENFTNHPTSNQAIGLAGAGFNVTKSYHLWWDPKHPDQTALWKSEIILNRDFYDEITSYPVPIDMRVLKAIKRSPLALDIYCWLTYRMSYLGNPTTIPWAALQMQFGAGYATNPKGVKNFRAAFLKELHKVKQFYPNANAESVNNGLILKPSMTHIPKKSKSSSQLKPQSEQSEPDELKLELIKKYSEYSRDKLIEIVEQHLEECDRKSLLAEFNNYLERSQVDNADALNLSDPITQEWLYRFVSNNWHHLIEQIKSFEDFLITIDENNVTTS